MRGEGREAEGEPGWLGGLPVAIKDLADVAGVRTTYGSPIFKDHVPAASHPVVERIERKGGIVIAKSNTPEFGAGGSTFNEVFGRTHQPLEHGAHLRRLDRRRRGGAGGRRGVAGARHGSRRLAAPAGHLLLGGGPAALARPRHARHVEQPLRAAVGAGADGAHMCADLALFLDTMAGLLPARSADLRCAGRVVHRRPSPRRRRRSRVAFTADFGGKVPVDRETREICAKAVRRFEDAGRRRSRRPRPIIGRIDEAFMVLRAQHYVVDRELQLEDASPLDQAGHHLEHRARASRRRPSRIAWAERERAAFYRRVAAFFETYDLLVTPGRLDAGVRRQPAHARRPSTASKLEHYLGASLITAIPTLMGVPSIAVPCGFDRFGRPVGLQIVGPPRGEAALLQAAARFEAATGLAREVPIRPRKGTVPATA